MLIELSYTINRDMPKWPTNPEEKYEYNTAIRFGDVSNASSVYHHLHNGTHVDAPYHFDNRGKTIDQIPIDDFYYTSPYVLELPKKRGERVEIQDLQSVKKQISNADILLIYTGYSDMRESNPEEFVNDFPCFTGEAAAYLRKEFPKLKAIALDSISFDSATKSDEEGFPSHHELLVTNEEKTERTLLLFEDVNIKKIVGVSKIQAIFGFPIRFEGLEAGPVAMVALV